MGGTYRWQDKFYKYGEGEIFLLAETHLTASRMSPEQILLIELDFCGIIPIAMF